jgi:hypothetical protein
MNVINRCHFSAFFFVLITIFSMLKVANLSIFIIIDLVENVKGPN